MNWIAMKDRKPDFGQRVLITFGENYGRLRVCYYDNEQTWSDRVGDYCDFGEGEWFTEADDSNDTWDPQYVSHWSAIPELPSLDGASK